MPKILSNLQKWQRDKYIKSSAIAGKGAMNTLRGLQDIGLPMRKTDALKWYREYAKIPLHEDAIKHTKKQATISRDRYVNQAGYMKRRYRYIVKYQTWNKTTGELQWFKTGVISNTEMLPWQVEMEAEKGVAKGIDRSPFEVRELYVAEAHHRSGDTWQ